MQVPAIRRVGVDDVETLQQLSRQTFFETFAKSNTEADMTKYLTENLSTETLLAELSNPNSLFFIAWMEQEPIGYLKLNFGDAQADLQEDTSVEIERIYVKADHLGKGVGQILYEKALEIAQLEQKSSIWLAVWEKNPRAISFYKKNGFIEFDTHIFVLGDDKQTDIMMRKTLN